MLRAAIFYWESRLTVLDDAFKNYHGIINQD